MDYRVANAEAIDRWVEDGWEWGRPISRDEFERAKAGDWDVVLTPTRPVPHEWLGELDGKEVLGLASGGGQQMPILAALGARCTVLDYSERQLESEAAVAQREGYEIRLVRADMARRLPFRDGSFDIVFHPVSNCYVEDVRPIWRECHRVLRRGGVLLAGADHYVNYIVDQGEERVVNRLPYNPLKDDGQMRRAEREGGPLRFSHSIEEQIGGPLEAGFTLTGLYEDTNGTGRLHELGIPTYIAARWVKG